MMHNSSIHVDTADGEADGLDLTIGGMDKQALILRVRDPNRIFSAHAIWFHGDLRAWILSLRHQLNVIEGELDAKEKQP